MRNWLHAADTARAITTIIERGVENEIYNIAGSFEQPNADAVYKIIKSYLGGKDFNLRDYIDASFSRVGQDLRYALDDEKLRGLGWKPERFFDDEIDGIVKYYKNNFIW